MIITNEMLFLIEDSDAWDNNGMLYRFETEDGEYLLGKFNENIIHSILGV